MAILGKQRAEELECIYNGMLSMTEMLAGNQQFRGFNAVVKGAKEYMETIMRAIDEQSTVVYVNTGQTPELIRAMGDDILVLPQEAYMLFQAICGDVEYNNKATDIAVAYGLPTDVCATDKTAVGYMLQNLMPPPTCSVYHSSPCENQLLGAQIVKEVYGRPVFPVDIPHLNGAREIEYVVAQLKEEIKFLEEHTGKKFCWERFQTICEESNNMTDKILEWNQLRRAFPSPQSGKMASLMLVILQVFSGTELGTWIISELAADAKDKIARGESVVPSKDEIRAVWYVNPIYFDLSIYDWMENELGLVVCQDLFGYMATEPYIDTSTQESMLKGLAYKLMNSVPMVRQGKGDYGPWIEDWMQMASDYKADCAIFGGHIACKGSTCLLGLAKEVFREAEIPLLSLEFDFLDNRVVSSDELKGEISRFVNDVMRPRIQKTTA